jgi:hypothetical protein
MSGRDIHPGQRAIISLLEICTSYISSGEMLEVHRTPNPDHDKRVEIEQKITFWGRMRDTDVFSI